MTLPNWNIDDYKVDFPASFYAGEIVNAPIVHKIKTVLIYIAAAIKDAVKAVRNGSGLSGLLLGFAIVDYLAGYYCGHKTLPNDYKDFMKQYFPEEYHPFLDSIYGQLRSGLVHNLVAINPYYKGIRVNYLIVEKPSSQHLDVLEDGRVLFSIDHFLQDTYRAFVMYQYDLLMKPDENSQLVENFHRRYNRLGGIASAMILTNG